MQDAAAKPAEYQNPIVTGVIWKQLLMFFFPILLGTFFQQLYNTVDAVIVGQFVGKQALAAVGDGSPASFALRFAASLPGVEMVLSGMGTPDMVAENVRTFSPLVPLAREEHAAVERVAQILRGQGVVECTGCRYCVDGCPKRINIPELFSCLNAKRGYNEDSAGYYYRTTHTGNGHGLASECVGCGACERACPQHLPIRELLREVAAEFETDSEE